MSTIPSSHKDLPSDHQDQIIKIRTCFQKWLLATSDIRKGVSGARERLAAATKNLEELEISPEYAFTPSPPYKFRRVLLSCIKCYWLALISSFDSSEREELSTRLDLTPPCGNRIPKFNGKKCVEQPGDLSAKVYEGLMRTVTLVVIGMTDDDVVRLWRELAEVGVQTWEERD